MKLHGWERKKRSAADAAALVRSDDTLAVPLGPGQPPAFLHALGERDDWNGLEVFGALLTEPFRLFARPGVRLLSGFFGPIERGLRQGGHDVRFVPADFRGFRVLAEKFRCRVMATIATPPDAGGWMSLGLHAGATVEDFHRAGRDPERLVVAEINPRLPRTLGLPPEHTHALHVDEVDVIVESELPIFALPDTEPSEVERAIASHAAHFIPDGATLQTGIGGVPSAVAGLLASGSGGDYGIHSEMYTTGLMRLQQAGKITNRKGVHDGYAVVTFAAGTAELNAWLDGRTDVRFLPIDAVNDPAVIARNRNMVSMNGALSIDFAGQLAADAFATGQHSGIGGHEDFVSAPVYAAGGRSLVCLPSTASVGEQLVSRIVATLPPGTPVTTPRHHVDVVVTEWGAAELFGKTTLERAAALVEVAHPKFRDGLREEADRLAASAG